MTSGGLHNNDHLAKMAWTVHKELSGMGTNAALGWRLRLHAGVKRSVCGVILLTRHKLFCRLQPYARQLLTARGLHRFYLLETKLQIRVMILYTPFLRSNGNPNLHWASLPAEHLGRRSDV